MEDALTRSGRRRKSVLVEVSRNLAHLRMEAMSIKWSKVFKASFMLLFVAYPGAWRWRCGVLDTALDAETAVGDTQRCIASPAP